MIVLTDLQLSKLAGGDYAIVAALRQLFAAVSSGETGVALNVAATKALQDATVITLSPNDTLTSERVLQQGRGLQLNDTGTTLTIGLAYNFNVNGGFRLTINTLADTDFTIPTSGTAMIEEQPVAVLGNYASDSAAATGGVPVGGLYRNGGAVQVRVA